ncbi:hypothetical protein [Bacillus sp. NSP9.1]|uniref:hypothetical protein n=1 Tax=Bacillus sp. NSP9.1 TaxID=1071078 RepID=UPI0013D4156E|nr:hypothetical protein [Bacillus sp. NSP9.1]
MNERERLIEQQKEIEEYEDVILTKERGLALSAKNKCHSRGFFQLKTMEGSIRHRPYDLEKARGGDKADH